MDHKRAGEASLQGEFDCVPGACKAFHPLAAAMIGAMRRWRQEALAALERRVAEGLVRMEFLATRMESVDRSTTTVLRMCVIRAVCNITFNKRHYLLFIFIISKALL
jgi:hypothetical protein